MLKDLQIYQVKLLILLSVITGLWVTPIFKGKIQPFEVAFTFLLKSLNLFYIKLINSVGINVFKLKFINHRT